MQLLTERQVPPEPVFFNEICPAGKCDSFAMNDLPCKQEMRGARMRTNLLSLSTQTERFVMRGLKEASFDGGFRHDKSVPNMRSSVKISCIAGKNSV